MVCPLCKQRRARRACPALGQHICAVCCGTKRLVEIECPADCSYLASAQEHPAAVTVRQRQRDWNTAVHLMRDFNERQSQLFSLVASSLVQYKPLELHRIVDEDVGDAAAALAATFETASRGVIYEHRPSSLPAERLAAALKAVLAEAGRNAGTAFERDAAVVLRRIEEAARSSAKAEGSGARSLLTLLARLTRRPGKSPGESEPSPATEKRLIIP